ncbi:MAG: hypothetical protein ACREN6_10455 [Gemmatimonadaceae bacterium]
MTAIAMHPAPRWRDVATEQVLSVGLMLRAMGILLAATLLIYGTVAIRVTANAYRLSHPLPNFAYTPEVTVFITYLALILPALIWHDESPKRRVYHAAMPVARSTHALTRAFAGWVWLMAGTAAFLLVVVAVDAIAKGIGGPSGRVPVILAWEWLVPFASVTIAYAFASAAAIGAETPAVWILGVPVLYASVSFGIAMFGDAALSRSMLTVLSGRYGASSAMGGWISDMNAAGISTGLPSAERWLFASLIWGAAAAVVLIVVSKRRAALK